MEPACYFTYTSNGLVPFKGREVVPYPFILSSFPCHKAQHPSLHWLNSHCKTAKFGKGRVCLLLSSFPLPLRVKLSKGLDTVNDKSIQEQEPPFSSSELLNELTATHEVIPLSFTRGQYQDS